MYDIFLWCVFYWWGVWPAGATRSHLNNMAYTWAGCVAYWGAAFELMGTVHSLSSCLAVCVADYWWAALVVECYAYWAALPTELHCLRVDCMTYWKASLSTGRLHCLVYSVLPNAGGLHYLLGYMACWQALWPTTKLHGLMAGCIADWWYMWSTTGGL